MKTRRQRVSIMRMNNMELGAYENCEAIVALHRYGIPPTKIVKTSSASSQYEIFPRGKIAPFVATNNIKSEGSDYAIFCVISVR